MTPNDSSHNVPATPGATSRADFILKGAFAAAAAYGLAAVAPYVSSSLAAEGRSDVQILNFLLPFEYLQISLYNRGQSERNTLGEKMKLNREERQFIDQLVEEEGQHVAALKEAIAELGGEPVDKGSYAFAYREFLQLLELASVLENAAIGAYNGAIPGIDSADARQLALSIVQVEARHAANVLISRKEDPAPEAFDRGDSEQNSINSVVQFTGVPG